MKISHLGDYLYKEFTTSNTGEDEYSNCQIITAYRATDGRLFDNFDDALKYDKLINVLARHRDEVPDKINTYICSDGIEFVDTNFDCNGVYQAREYQSKLDFENKLHNKAEILYGNGINSFDDLKESLRKNYKEIFGPGMLFG